MKEMKEELGSEEFDLLASSFHGRGSQKGWRFERLDREGNAALYEKYDETIDVERVEDIRFVYEVIEVRVSKASKQMIGGVEVEFKAKERYPSDEEFGSLGWSYGSKSDALERYEWLKRRIADRQKSNDSVLSKMGVSFF